MNRALPKRTTSEEKARGYIQGFVVPVQKAKKGDYRKMCQQFASLFKEYGARQVFECWGKDVPDGQVTDFKRAVQAKPDENIVFSWIVWPDRAPCDAASRNMPDDERMKPSGDMPFDMQRMLPGV
ncbi:MAG: DUF1428 domain-containing protein [Rhodanobacteraceae bacterium]